MSHEQLIVFGIIFFAMVMFIWGKLRYDLVAVLALMIAVLSGVVPAEKAYEGFGHAAVITVAAVLIISKALQKSGVVEYLVQILGPTRKTATIQVGATSALSALLSCVMNNVGALALMLPVTLRNAHLAGSSPSLLLIPLSFASLLGGLVTLIGTPPNIVVASYRQQISGEPFSMFDFTPVGALVAVAGLCYLAIFGWRLLPERVLTAKDSPGVLHAGTYSVETNIPEGSPMVGKRVKDLEIMGDQEVSVLAIIRKGVRRLAPRATERFREHDIVILQGDPALVQTLADGKQLGTLGIQAADTANVQSDDVVLVEAIVLPNAPIEGRSMRGVRLHDRYGVNLLALSRSGRAATARLKNTTFRAGDVLLLQGEPQTVDQVLRTLGCLPLANRGLQVQTSGGMASFAVALFAAAIAAAATGLVTVPIAFTCAVVLLILSSVITLSEAYESIEWPVILLLATLIPVGEALQHTGGTDLIAQGLISLVGGAPIWLVLAAVMIVSMWLSDLVHNTPTAILMAPIAASIAVALGANIDAFLMAVAVGAASPYLTPIGHQSNTLVMGPGGYRFTDYAIVGAPMQIIIVLVGVPAISYFWL